MLMSSNALARRQGARGITVGRNGAKVTSDSPVFRLELEAALMSDRAWSS